MKDNLYAHRFFLPIPSSPNRGIFTKKTVENPDLAAVLAPLQRFGTQIGLRDIIIRHSSPIRIMKHFSALALFFLLSLAATTGLQAQTAADENVTFEQFLQQFPKQSLPFTFSEAELQGQLENGTPRAKRLDWQFYQFIPTLERSAQTSRMTVYPEPVACFETEEHFAVLYNLARGLSKGNKCYEIAVYDKQGNFIATRVVAGVNVQSLSSATIDANLGATVKSYEVNWMAETHHVTGLTSRDTQTFDLTMASNDNEWNGGAFSQALNMTGASNQK